MERDYEALVILKATGSEQDLARSIAQLEEPIKRLGGRIQTSQGWGRRKLAYRIARQTEGHYHFLRFAAPTDRVGELKQLYRLSDVVVRFLILNHEEDGARASTDTVGEETRSPSPHPSTEVS